MNESSSDPGFAVPEPSPGAIVAPLPSAPTLVQTVSTSRRRFLQYSSAATVGAATLSYIPQAYGTPSGSGTATLTFGAAHWTPTSGSNCDTTPQLQIDYEVSGTAGVQASVIARWQTGIGSTIFTGPDTTVSGTANNSYTTSSWVMTKPAATYPGEWGWAKLQKKLSNGSYVTITEVSLFYK